MSYVGRWFIFSSITFNKCFKWVRLVYGWLILVQLYSINVLIWYDWCLVDEHGSPPYAQCVGFIMVHLVGAHECNLILYSINFFM